MIEHRPLMIVEDSPEDYKATVRAFKKAKLVNPIQHCEDGDEALDYLFRRGKFADPTSSPRPAVILLDLNLPGTDGRDVLKEIKADENLKVIPVLVLTSSSDERDIEACYQAGANSYVRKPVDMSGLIQAIERLKEFWLGIAILPPVD